MLTQGTLVRFRVYQDENGEDYWEFFLKYLETDELGMKMSGGLPPFWRIKRGAVFGPELFWNDQRFSIAKIDRKRNQLWLLGPCPDEAQTGV